MRQVLPSIGLVAFALVTTPACQSHGSDESGKAEGQEPIDDGSSPPALDDRIPSMNAPAVGLAPGYVDGALIYASWRAGVMQELLRTIPVPPDEARDLAEFGAVLG